MHKLELSEVSDMFFSVFLTNSIVITICFHWTVTFYFQLKIKYNTQNFVRNTPILKLQIAFYMILSDAKKNHMFKASVKNVVGVFFSVFDCVYHFILITSDNYPSVINIIIIYTIPI